MTNNLSQPETAERQLLTREFADSLAGKSPDPYLRVHDPVQKYLADCAGPKNEESILDQEYVQRMFHFWREISLAGIPFSGREMDECYAFLLESSFALAQEDLPWAMGCLAEKSRAQLPLDLLRQLAHQTTSSRLGHSDIVAAFTALNAQHREGSTKWNNEIFVMMAGEVWFWGGIICAVEPDSSDPISAFARKLDESFAHGWRDARLHPLIIREASIKAEKTSGAELMAHPLLRLARRKYEAGSVELQLVLRFLNAQCIADGFESEEDCFCDPLRLARWVRDARAWAENLIRQEPGLFASLCYEMGEAGLNNCRQFYGRELGESGIAGDNIDLTVALMKWANRMRGCNASRYRAQLWEFLVNVVDAALWLGWLFPRPEATSKPTARPVSQKKGEARLPNER